MTSSPPSGARQARGSVSRCPACGSRIRPEQSWCSLCHHSLLTGEQSSVQPGSLDPESKDPESPDPESLESASPDPESLESASLESASPDPESLESASPDPESLESASPESASREPVSLKKREPTGDPSVIDTGDRLIAELAAAEADRTRESGLAGLQGRFGDRNGGVILAVVGGVLLLGVGVLGLTLLGLIV